MKTIIAAVLLTLAAPPAFAVTEPLQPAPVSPLSRGSVAPADRAGDTTATSNSAPFSGVPSNTIAGQGQVTPQNPVSVNRDTAPAPNVSK